jgi:flotillin
MEKADADKKLKTREIEIARELNLEQIKAERTAQHKDAELQRGVEEKRAAMELERLRATTVTQAKIARESAEQKADAQYYAKSKEAAAHLVNQQAEADAEAYRGEKDAQIAAVKKTRDAEASFMVAEREAEAYLIAKQKEAEANFIVKQKEAAGITETAKAYGELAKVMGGPQGLMQYLMLQNNTYEKLALANAKAINGLQPKINVWNTGSAGGEGADPTAPIRNLFQTLPPLLSTIHDQTGMQPPSWLARMPEQNGPMSDVTAQEKVRAKQEALMNGNGHTNGV